MADITVSVAVDTFMQAVNAAAARSALGLGTAAILDSGTGAGDAILGNDARLADARTPAAHAASHLTGSDQIATATASVKGVMSAAAMAKLDGISADANNYSLPIPTTTVMGGVKRNVGAGGQFVSGINADGDLIHSTPSGGGDVVGPASAVDDELALFDGASGKLIKSAGFNGAGLVQGTRSVSTTHSLSGGGDLTADRTLQLVGDAATPGNTRYYGTDGAGVKGFHEVPTTTVPGPKRSIELDAAELQLVGDAASPGNSKYYGTSGAGAKGFHDIPAAFAATETQSGTTFSPGLADAGKYIRLTHASGCTITVLQQSTIAWLANTELYFRVAAAGVHAVTEGSGVTVNNRTAAAALAIHDTFALKRISENVWDFI